MKRTPAFLVLVVLTIAAAVAAFRIPGPPDPLPADAPTERFSAGRAENHLQRMARAPRHLGSEAHARVLGELVETVQKLGLETELQASTYLRRRSQRFFGARLTNVVARIPGRASSDGTRRAVLLMAHYDSVPAGPGAGDDASGVAALLETARALVAGPPTRHDVLLLLTDGEEAGLLGARAFEASHPWAADVAAVINFEARGTRGPAVMFETGRSSGPLVAALRDVPHRPIAASYSTEIYRRMPNDTDFSIFRDVGLPGLNFAFIHDATGYHTAQDSLERLDRASVQHLGELALALARHLADSDLEDLGATAGDAIYLNLLGLLVVLPAGLATPLAVVLLAAVVILLGLGIRRGHLGFGRLAVATVALLAATGLIGTLLTVLAPIVHPGSYNFSLWDGAASQSLGLLSLVFLGLAAASGIHRFLDAKPGSDPLFGAALLLFIVGLVGVTAIAPGAMPLLAFPLVPAVLYAALAWRREASPEPSAEISPLLVVALAAVAVMAALVFTPTLALLGVALGKAAAGVAGGVAAFVLLGLLAPVLGLAPAGWGGRSLPAVTLVGGLALAVALHGAVGFDENNRQLATVVYELDTTSGEARWLAFDDRPNPWTSLFLGDEPEETERPFYFSPGRMFAAPAPAAELTAPEVSLVASTPVEEGHRFEIRIDETFPVERLIFTLHSDDGIREVTIDGQSYSIDSPEDGAYISLFAPAGEGLGVGVLTGGAAPLEIEVAAQRYTLMGLPGVEIPERPATTMPGYNWSSDMSFVRGTTTVTSETVTPGTTTPEAVPVEN